MYFRRSYHRAWYASELERSLSGLLLMLLRTVLALREEKFGISRDFRDDRNLKCNTNVYSLAKLKS